MHLTVTRGSVLADIDRILRSPLEFRFLTYEGCDFEATSVAWMDASRRATVATGSLAPQRRASESCATLLTSPLRRAPP